MVVAVADRGVDAGATTRYGVLMATTAQTDLVKLAALRVFRSVIDWAQSEAVPDGPGFVEHPSYVFAEVDNLTLVEVFAVLVSARTMIDDPTVSPPPMEAQLMDSAAAVVQAEIVGRLAALDPDNAF